MVNPTMSVEHEEQRTDEHRWVEVWTIPGPDYDPDEVTPNDYYLIPNNLTPHKEDGPAIIRYYDEARTILASEMWFQNGKQCRADGPSCIVYHVDGQVDYCFWRTGEGKRMETFEEWLDAVDIPMARRVELKLMYGGSND